MPKEKSGNEGGGAKKKKKFSSVNIKSLLLFKAHIIGPIGFIIILGAGYLFLLKPRIDFLTNKTAETDISHWQNELQNKKTARDNLLKETERFESLRDLDMSILNTILPGEFDSQSLMFEVESVVGSAGLALKSISITEQKGGAIGLGDKDAALPPNIKKAVITIGVSGIRGYAGLKTFLKRLEDNAHVFDVLSFPLITENVEAAEAESEAGDQGDKIYEFSIQTYFLEN